MQQKYNWPDKIPDEAIKEQFRVVSEVRFSARRFNYIALRFIAFGDLGWWLPLTRVLLLIGITPQMLRPVFNPHQEDKTNYWVEGVELPTTIESYEQLGNFPLSHEPFQELARILGKSVKVAKEDDETGHHYSLFTAHPSGKIVESVNV